MVAMVPEDLVLEPARVLEWVVMVLAQVVVSPEVLEAWRTVQAEQVPVWVAPGPERAMGREMPVVSLEEPEAWRVPRVAARLEPA
jgi:hypothetical protein